MKNFIRYLPIWLVLGTLSLISAYKILVVQREIYNEYNGMKGTVTWATYANRSAIYLCGIRLEDGTYGEVNWGSSPVEVGDRFTNRMQYGYIMGIVGTAYVVEPDNMPGVMWAVCYLFLFVCPLLYLLCYWLIYKPIRWWIKNH